MIRFTELNIILINKDKNTPINEKVYLLAIQGSRLFFALHISIYFGYPINRIIGVPPKRSADCLTIIQS